MPIEVTKSIYVSVHIASKIMGLSPRRITQLCQLGAYETAFKPGSGPNSHWRILRAELAARKYNQHLRDFNKINQRNTNGKTPRIVNA